MYKTSKRVKNWQQTIDTSKIYDATTAFELIKKFSTVSFKESIDVAIQLGIDPRKSNQVIRGSSILPHGTGKNKKIIAFVQGDNIKIAKDAGADIIASDASIEKIKNKEIEFDIVIAMPDTMTIVSKLGAILGPKGLMPNPKLGTVTKDIKKTIDNIKLGQIQYRVDKSAIIHSKIGNTSFEIDSLKQNLETLVMDLKKLKPSSTKGTYLKKITVSSTMGPGLTLDIVSLNM